MQSQHYHENLARNESSNVAVEDHTELSRKQEDDLEISWMFI